MHKEITRYHCEKGWIVSPTLLQADLVICFINDHWIDSLDAYNICRQHYVRAENILIVGSGGQIVDEHLIDDELCMVAIQWEHSTSKGFITDCTSFEQTRKVASAAAQAIMSETLRHVLVFADAQHINGTELLKGLYDVLPAHIGVSGGLASDGKTIKQSRVGLNHNPQNHKIAVIGLYGDRLQIHCSAQSGWLPFGPIRTVTKAQENKLFEADGLPVFDIYKQYINANDAQDLTTHSLYHPLAVLNKDGSDFAIRAIVALDAEEKSLTLTCDIPQGSIFQLTHCHYKGVIAGAEEAAEQIRQHANLDHAFVLMVDCIARRLLLGMKTEDELEVVKEVLPNTPCIGFYSHGEIAWHRNNNSCKLHNQTMTMTSISE